MLKSIAKVATEMLAFLEILQLPLSKPQKQHVSQVANPAPRPRHQKGNILRDQPLLLCASATD